MSATEEQHAAAIIALLTAADANPLDLDDIANMIREPAKYGSLPAYYTEVTVSRMFGGETLADGTKGTESFRVTTRAVAKTVSNAREMRRRSHVALEFAHVTVAGVTSTPIQFESAQSIGPDEGWYSGLTTWTYTI